MSTIKLPSSLVVPLLAALFATSIMNTVLPIGFNLDDIFAQEASFSCSCRNEVPKTAKEAFENSNMVFVGRVTEILDASP
jgi:hypothetical protein